MYINSFKEAKFCLSYGMHMSTMVSVGYVLGTNTVQFSYELDVSQNQF